MTMEKDHIKEAIREMLADDDDRQLFGNMIIQALNVGLQREIKFEDGRTEPGRTVEKTETWNLLDWLAKYLPLIEGAIRGCQADSAGARNKATETRDHIRQMAGGFQQLLDHMARLPAPEHQHMVAYMCPNCSQAVRVPAGQGLAGVTCNSCSTFISTVPATPAGSGAGAIGINKD